MRWSAGGACWEWDKATVASDVRSQNYGPPLDTLISRSCFRSRAGRNSISGCVRWMTKNSENVRGKTVDKRLGTLEVVTFRSR